MPRLGSGVPLVARAAELDRLRTSLTRADAGAAGAVLVSGDAGVGKSRLLDELASLATARGALVLTGRCLDVGETGLPYLPFVEMLTQLHRRDAASVTARPVLERLLPGSVVPALPESAPALPFPGEGARPPERDLGQLRLFDALIGLFTDLAAQRCVVLLVEDLHWADPSTRDLVSFLLSRLRDQRLLAVASYRSDDLHRRHPLRPMLAELVRLPTLERIDLTPFAAEDARSFVAALAEEPVGDEVIRQVAERSEGNAFFAEELMAEAAYGPTGMPTGLADLLLARIERLSPAGQNVLRVASVAGRRVRHTRLLGVAGLDPVALDEALREAVQHHVLLVPDDGMRLDGAGSVDAVYAFRHALLREAVYGDLLPGERVRLHGAYARHIAASEAHHGSAAALAHHSFQSHDLTTALSASVRAATDTRILGAPAESLRHLELALKLWDGVPPGDRPEGVTEAQLLRRASVQAQTAGEPERAAAFARAAVNLVDTDGLDGPDAVESAALSHRRLAQALLNLDGRQSEALEAIQEAWRLVEDRPASGLRAWVLAILAASLRSVDPAMARTAAEDAIADARAVRAADAEADALVTLGMLDELAERGDSALRHFTDAVATAAGDPDASNPELRARYFLGLHAYDAGRLPEAVREFRAGADRARENGLTWSSYGLELRLMTAISGYVAGDWDGSAAAAEPPMRQVSDTIVARLSSVGAFVAVGRGRFDEVTKLLADLRGHWHRDVEIVLFTAYNGAEMELWRGEPATAMRWVDDVSATVERAGRPLLTGRIRLSALGLAAQAALARRARRDRDEAAGRAAVERADELVALAYEVATRGRTWNGALGPEGRAWLTQVAAERTRLDGAGDPDAWREVVAGFDYGNVYQLAIARLRLAEALVGADDRTGAADALTEAVTAANRLGARPLAGAAADLARRARLVVPGLSPARDQVDPFTPRERAVLSLVALGRTNRQVGQELFISEKTVSVHLSRIMAKLGASRRTEAVATAYERGLLEPQG